MVKYLDGFDDVATALAHPGRRLIVDRLRGRPATTTELARLLDIGLPAVTKQLTLLTGAAVVRSTKTGRVVTHEIQPAVDHRRRDGEFLFVESERRFTATWVCVEDGPDGDLEQIDVRFEGDPDGTRLTICHTGPWASPAPAEAYAQGWHDTLARLDALVG